MNWFYLIWAKRVQVNNSCRLDRLDRLISKLWSDNADAQLCWELATKETYCSPESQDVPYQREPDHSDPDEGFHSLLALQLHLKDVLREPEMIKEQAWTTKPECKTWELMNT